MEDMNYIHQWAFSLGGLDIFLNSATLINTWMIMAVLIAFGFLASRKTKLIPNPLQSLAEILVDMFDKLVVDTLELEDRKYFPFICTLFMFLLLSNIWGVFPKLTEPTRDLNTTLGLGLLGFAIAHYSGVKAKGVGPYFRDTYLQPIFLWFPLNVISELSKVVSISFRLFGNIRGGSIIIMVVSYLVYSLVLPPFLNIFFGIFVGAIQAFVFTMLTLVYISLQMK
jgi:F-type H+-transporting ATPase subunit a